MRPPGAESTRAILRAEQFEEKIRSRCAELKGEPGGASFHVRGEKEYPAGHQVFLRVMVGQPKGGFYVIPKSEECLVCFFKERNRGPSLARRLRRLMGAPGYAGLDDGFEVRRERIVLNSVTVEPQAISDADISEWLDYACSGFKRGQKPSVLRGRRRAS